MYHIDKIWAFCVWADGYLTSNSVANFIWKVARCYNILCRKITFHYPQKCCFLPHEIGFSDMTIEIGLVYNVRFQFITKCGKSCVIYLNSHFCKQCWQLGVSKIVYNDRFCYLPEYSLLKYVAMSIISEKLIGICFAESLVDKIR